MKKSLLAILFSGITLAANAQQIHFGLEATYPPFEFTDEKGTLVGFDVDLANAICQELKATCQFSIQNFDSLIPSVKAKKFDAAISSIDITASRAKQVAFTDAYYDSSASFIGLKNKADLTTAKNIGVQNGSTFQQYINQQMKQYNTNAYSALPASLLDLENGRIDAIFGDTAVLGEWLKENPNLQFIGKKVTDSQYFGNGFGIAVHKSNQTLLNELNKGLSAIKQNGEYQKIYDKWFAVK